MRTKLVAALVAALSVGQFAFGQAGGAAGQSGSSSDGQAGGVSSPQPDTTPVTPRTADDPNPITNENDAAPPFDDSAPTTAPESSTAPVDPLNPTTDQSTSDNAADQFPVTDSEQSSRMFRDRDNAVNDGNAQFDPGFDVNALGTQQGLSIGTVRSGGLAAEAGLQANDRIISIDGRTFTTVEEFRQFAPQLAGRRVPIVIERGGQQQTLSIEYPAAVARTTRGVGDTRGWLGVYLSPDFNGSGARISRLVPGSPAARAGLRAGDIVTGLNGQDIWSYQALVDAVADIEPNTQVNLQVMRNGRLAPITATLASIQRAAYRGDYRRESGYYGEPPAPPEWYSRSDALRGDRIDRLEQMILQLQEEVRALRADLTRR